MWLLIHTGIKVQGKQVLALHDDEEGFPLLIPSWCPANANVFLCFLKQFQLLTCCNRLINHRNNFVLNLDFTLVLSFFRKCITCMICFIREAYFTNERTNIVFPQLWRKCESTLMILYISYRKYIPELDSVDCVVHKVFIVPLRMPILRIFGQVTHKISISL